LSELVPRTARPPARVRGRALRTPAGSVSAFFALEGYDRRRGIATYALRVINRTKSPLLCRTWILSRDGAARSCEAAVFEAAPLSTSETQIPIRPADFPSFDRAVAEVAGQGVHCFVEAAAPQLRRSRLGFFMAAGVMLLLGMLSLVAGAALRETVPRIAAFVVPPEALVGTTVRAQYSAMGAGQLAYEVVAPDGRRLQGGKLQERAGSIDVAIPSSSEPAAYVLRMSMHGMLGDVSETRVLNAIVARIPGAQIENVSVHPIVAQPGQTVDVEYAAVADAGYVRLVGSDGTIWAQKPYASDGQTSFVIPPVPGAREMRVMLRVTKGRSAAQSAAGIAIAGASNVAAAQAVQIDGDDDPSVAAATSGDENGVFDVLNRTARSGQPIRVRILSPRNGMRIALDDARSREITGIDAGADADVVTLRAPAVLLATRYTIVASFTDGFGQESVVQPVTILP